MARFSDLPEELLEEIMSWLPPESLKQFKCVHKSWYFYITALMNDPEFVAKHLLNAKNKLLSHPLLYFTSLWTISCPQERNDSSEASYLLSIASTDSSSVNDCIPCVTEDLKFLNSGHFYECSKVVSHCNGIICFYDYYSQEEKNIIFLVNPALRELKTVPDAHFDDDYEIRGVGFGYDSRANDYKVVTIKSEDELSAGPFKAEVYSLGTNSWKEIELNVEIIYFSMYEYQVVYCNGVCYWYFWDIDVSIVAFDFSNELFQSIPYPEKAPRIVEQDDALEKSSKIAVWNGSIALFIYLELDPLLIDMWVLDACSGGVEGSYSWTRHQTIEPLVGINQPVLFWGNEVLFMENKDLEIVPYHLSTKELDDRFMSTERFSNRLVICEKSLVSVLKKRTGEAQKMQSANMCMGWADKEAKHDEMVQKQTEEEQPSVIVEIQKWLNQMTDCLANVDVVLQRLLPGVDPSPPPTIKKSIEPSTSHSSTSTDPLQQPSIILNMLRSMRRMIDSHTKSVNRLHRLFPGIDISMPPPLPLILQALLTQDEDNDDTNSDD
ncbi:hypothetical protein TIFTF001_013136 [Ficus carica]|uniref:F-box domain-containing protein n=1 Tax=Ficus carica TaxID=3494 RepID=A0AA88ADP2_FICCA|nr:hypothetical protein TIFTF001_013136 [Ficus carica]